MDVEVELRRSKRPALLEEEVGLVEGVVAIGADWKSSKSSKSSNQHHPLNID